VTLESALLNKNAKKTREMMDLQPLEIILNYEDRIKYLMNRVVKVVGMTSTVFAMKFKELMESGFSYENVIVLDSNQMLEVETFFPLNSSKLNKVTMFGDVEQIGPMVRNQVLCKYSKMNTSLFARSVRLGRSMTHLNIQCEISPNLMNLIRFKYPIKDEHVSNQKIAGLQYDYQFIQVEDFKGHGEISYQNLGEAEYVVALYQYLRLNGYTRNQITILTPYQSQKKLIMEILERRCRPFEIYLTCQVETLDKFQGQLNDIVLISLVRTKEIGYLNDCKRFHSIFTHARHGMYVCGRRQVFEKEYSRVLEPLFHRPTTLTLDSKQQMTDLVEFATLVYKMAQN
jgi:intron-binding protein aquarius